METVVTCTAQHMPDLNSCQHCLGPNRQLGQIICVEINNR